MKDKSKLVSVVIYCDVLKKEVTIEENFFSLSASSQECDVCGSHGNMVEEHLNLKDVTPDLPMVEYQERWRSI